MKPGEYSEMVGLIETWWGHEAAGPWKDTANFDLYEALPSDPVYAVLTVLRDGGRYPDFPPKPPALRAAVLDFVHNTPPEALPAPPVEAFDWDEYSRRTYGEVISLDRAVAISADAQRAGVPTPSPWNPWRRPDSPEDAADGPEPGPRDPTPTGVETVNLDALGPPDDWEPNRNSSLIAAASRATEAGEEHDQGTLLRTVAGI